MSYPTGSHRLQGMRPRARYPRRWERRRRSGRMGRSADERPTLIPQDHCASPPSEAPGWCNHACQTQVHRLYGVIREEEPQGGKYAAALSSHPSALYAIARWQAHPWQKRYFIFNEIDRSLCYNLSREKCHSDATTTSIRFEDVLEVVRHPTKPCRFELVTKRKNHKLRAENEKLATQWIRVLSIPIKLREEESEQERKRQEAEEAAARKRAEVEARAKVCVMDASVVRRGSRAALWGAGARQEGGQAAAGPGNQSRRHRPGRGARPGPSASAGPHEPPRQAEGQAGGSCSRCRRRRCGGQ